MEKSLFSLPFTFSEVLAEEYAVLKSSEGPPRSDPAFVEQDLPNPSALLNRILDGKTALSRYIVERYGAGLKEANLIKHFNALVNDPSLYTVDRFTEVELDSHAQGLVRYLPEFAPEDRARVHRVLLEQAYGPLITKLEDRRRKEVYRQAHSNPLAALCLSGGGIRSATFALGVLQGLAHQGVLTSFSYLSTVSGGGYIGSWLSAWAYRHPNGLAGVMALLGHPSRSPTVSEPSTLHHLRTYSNYLTPHLGVLSGDTWALIGTYLRNLILDWVILVPLLIAAILIGPLLLGWHSESVSGETPALVVGLVSGAIALTYLHMFRASLRRYQSSQNRAQEQGSFLRLALAPMIVSALLLSTYASHHLAELGEVQSSFRIVMGALLFNLVTWAISLGMQRRPVRTSEVAAIVASGIFGGVILWYAITLVSQDVDDSVYVAFGVPTVLTMFLLAATLFIGVASRWTDDEDREWWARAGGWMLMAALLWLVGGLLTLFAPSWYLKFQRQIPGVLESVGGIAGLLTLLLGYSKRTPGPTGSMPQSESKNWMGAFTLGITTPLFIVSLVVVLTVGVQLLLGVSADWRIIELGEASGHRGYLHPGTIVAIIVGCGLLAALASNYVNINKFSLHAMYRNRLIRAYLGASREHRRPNPFTGFDALDNVPMTYLNPVFLWPGDIVNSEALASQLERATAGTLNAELQAFRARLNEIQAKPSGFFRHQSQSHTEARVLQAVNGLIAGPLLSTTDEGRLSVADVPRGENGLLQTISNRRIIERLCSGTIRPFEMARPNRCLHVINTALNVVKGQDLAWQQRKAESMTLSPLHAGNHRLGYRSVKQYAKGDGPDPITLGTAMAISGAAASPNMGYHSSPIVTLIMTLFNIRLGWWLGNPGAAGMETHHHAHPHWALRPLLEEAFGLTDDTRPYVYLSDGGHFENLGLYEMVLRRCRYIVVCDAGHDPECHFEDLGNAIRKIRIDLGITVAIDQCVRILPRGCKETGKYCAKGRIIYKDVDGEEAPDGTLIYLKPTFCGSESADIYNYAMSNQAFPHEPTSNQWFNESQFESYRMLGRHIIDEISGGNMASVAGPLENFVNNVESYLKQ